jgi:chemotaxis protein histidine kinase CheA
VTEEELRSQMLRLVAGELERRAERVERVVRELAARPDAERRGALVEALSLEAHNLVGTARTLGLSDVEHVAEGLESLATRVGRGDAALTGPEAATVGRALRSLAASYADEPSATAARPDGE